MCFKSEINTSHLSPRSYILISAVTIETFSALLEFDGLMNCMLTSHRPDGKKWWKTEKRRVKWKTLQLQELVWLESHFTASSEAGGRGDGSLLQTPEHRHGEDTKLSSHNRKKGLPAPGCSLSIHSEVRSPLRVRSSTFKETGERDQLSPWQLRDTLPQSHQIAMIVKIRIFCRVQLSLSAVPERHVSACGMNCLNCSLYSV